MYTKISKILLVVMACIGFQAEAGWQAMRYTFIVNVGEGVDSKSVIVPGAGLNLKVLKEALADKHMANAQITVKQAGGEEVKIDSDTALENVLMFHSVKNGKKVALPIIHISARN